MSRMSKEERDALREERSRGHSFAREAFPPDDLRPLNETTLLEALAAADQVGGASVIEVVSPLQEMIARRVISLNGLDLQVRKVLGDVWALRAR